MGSVKRFLHLLLFPVEGENALVHCELKKKNAVQPAEILCASTPYGYGKLGVQIHLVQQLQLHFKKIVLQQYYLD